MNYNVCGDGLHLTSVQPLGGWAVASQSNGPPTISATFSSGTTSVTCTLSYSAGGINASGPC